ncbi:MAG: methyltransferase domain-containing protein [Fulvimonas sp.]|jgi:SAM-dependent methyltransferase|nr:methyltransferase domain-containing protein [Fulvimonas sp.]
MPSRPHDIYASAPLRRLLDDELAALAPALQRCAGERALQIAAAPASPPALPMLGQWICLQQSGRCYDGDLIASTEAGLPFLDESFALVVLRHALEPARGRALLLGEAARVLMPGGMLALTGVHPLSGWLPWWLWRARRQRLSAQVPLGTCGWLRGADFSIERTRRVGPPWPGMARASGTHVLGGGYLLIARKRRPQTAPLRLPRRPLPEAGATGLATGAGRGVALQHGTEDHG